MSFPVIPGRSDVNDYILFPKQVCVHFSWGNCLKSHALTLYSIIRYLILCLENGFGACTASLSHNRGISRRRKSRDQKSDPCLLCDFRYLVIAVASRAALGAGVFRTAFGIASRRILGAGRACVLAVLRACVACIAYIVRIVCIVCHNLYLLKCLLHS